MYSSAAIQPDWTVSKAQPGLQQADSSPWQLQLPLLDGWISLTSVLLSHSISLSLPTTVLSFVEAATKIRIQLFTFQLSCSNSSSTRDKEARYYTNSKEQKMNQEIIINSSKGKITGENAGGPEEEEFYFLLLEEHD